MFKAIKQIPNLLKELIKAWKDGHLKKVLAKHQVYFQVQYSLALDAARDAHALIYLSEKETRTEREEEQYLQGLFKFGTTSIYCNSLDSPALHELFEASKIVEMKEKINSILDQNKLKKSRYYAPK